MARIKAYRKSKADEITDGTIQDANVVVGAGGSRNLRLTKEDGSIVDLGDVKGETGPQGPIGGGLTQAEAQEQLESALLPTAWQPLPLNDEWDPYPGWQAPRYRVLGDVVQLDGLVRRNATGSQTELGGLLTPTTLPSEMLPVGIGVTTTPASFMITSRDRGEAVTLYVVTANAWLFNGYISTFGTGFRPYSDGSWITLSGCSYTLAIES